MDSFIFLYYVIPYFGHLGNFCVIVILLLILANLRQFCHTLFAQSMRVKGYSVLLTFSHHKIANLHDICLSFPLEIYHSCLTFHTKAF